MIKDFFLLALRNIVKRGIRSWLTMIGIFIGIAAVVALIGLGEGLRTAISAQFGFLGTDVLSIQASGLNFAGPPGFGAVEPLSDKLAEKISKLNGVEAAFNRYLSSAKMTFNEKQIITFIGSIPIGENRKKFEEMSNLKTVEGRLLKDGDGRKIVLGNNFMNDNNQFKKTVRTGDYLLINGVKFQVVGILEKKGSFTIDGSVLMDEDVMLDYIREDDDTVNLIAVRVKDEREINNVKTDIEKLLRKERHVNEGEENFVVQTPQSMLGTLNSTLFAVQLFVIIIAVISLLVGGIGIMNTMYTAVLERTKEIGIMKAIGAKNSAIFSIFFIESGFMGTVGGLIGIAAGFILAHGFAAIGRFALGADLIQAKVSIFLILGALAFSFFLGTLFGTMPAYEASKLNPVDSIRSIK